MGKFEGKVQDIMTVKWRTSLDWDAIREVFWKEVILTWVSIRGGLTQVKS